jgi:hypothetical protein
VPKTTTMRWMPPTSRECAVSYREILSIGLICS